jgi:hypothetical protein
VSRLIKAASLRKPCSGGLLEDIRFTRLIREALFRRPHNREFLMKESLSRRLYEEASSRRQQEGGSLIKQY